MNYEDEYDESFEEDDGINVIVAELDWKPIQEKINWNDPDFAKNIAQRLKGITEETFAIEVQNWQESINSLPVYDEMEIRKEISQWNIGIPSRDQFDFESYTIFYSLQVQYRNRITEIHNLVFAHHEMLSQAQKTLKEMAVRLVTGTAVDKNGIASFTVHPFILATTHAKRLLTYLESVLKNIEFAASQMDRLLREHQALARINANFSNEGFSAMLSKDKMPRLQKFNDSAEIRTRNRR